MHARPLLLATGIVLVAGPLFAQGLSLPPGRWWDRPVVAREIGLSPEQRQRLEKLALDHAPTLIDLKAGVDKAELAVRARADEEPFDAAAARAAFSSLLAARDKLERERFDLLLATREVLSRPQWEKLRTMARERFTDRLRERREPGPAGP